ncbi:MAG: carboxylesterase family protein, partial [Bacilli bacterium]|nr:carboxylesterase family protein [Bacilli bacterium]
KTLAAKTYSGTYVGSLTDDNILIWKGIPFAKTPSKELRWKAPQRLDNSDRVYEAYYYGHSPVQLQSFDEVGGFYPQGEDCLNVNIWNNVNDTSTKKPIMVWIHGGGYIQGGAASPENDGIDFVRNNPEVIFASFDYRTDFLGFVNLSEVPGGEEYKESTNLGLLDEVAAIKWIKENAAAFGGDPDRITIFGESAGGGSVSALTVMPQAKGMFKRAIIQSGSVSNFLRTAEKSKSQTQFMLDITGCKNMSDLHELTNEDIRKIAYIVAIGGSANYTFPQLDGITLPLDLKAALENKTTREGIEILSGTNKDEYEHWTHIVGVEENTKSMTSSMRGLEAKLTADELARWNEFKSKVSPTTYKNLINQETYYAFHTPCRFEANTHAKNGGKVYQYLFTEPTKIGYIDPDTKNFTSYGAYHSFELNFEFGNINEEEFRIPVEQAKHFSKIFQQFWVNFALNGNPSISEGQVEGETNISWDAYTTDNKNVMTLNADSCYQEIDPLKENIDLISDIYWAKLR